jgi:very-short-patch-repair endonuclease
MSKLDRFKRQGWRSGRTETDAERTLWDNLHRVPLAGTHFRRQVEIGPYRADFGLLRLKLLIEVDGRVHDRAVECDLQRDTWLENEGYRVIRFTNQEITTDMNSVLRAIEQAVEDQTRALGLEP